jgi:hypothetical protein
MQEHPEESDVLLTPFEALRAMSLFLKHFYGQAGNDMETLMADITVESDGMTLDPAAWDDWQTCVAEAKGTARA